MESTLALQNSLRRTDWQSVLLFWELRDQHEFKVQMSSKSPYRADCPEPAPDSGRARLTNGVGSAMKNLLSTLLVSKLCHTDRFLETLADEPNDRPVLQLPLARGCR